MTLTKSEEYQHRKHLTYGDSMAIHHMAESTPDGERARWASPELVRRTVLEAAAAWPELAGLDEVYTSPVWAYAVIGPPGWISGQGGPGLGEAMNMRRDTLTNLREDAAKLAERAALAVRSAPKPPASASAFPLLEAPLDRAALDRQWARALGLAWSNPEPVLAPRTPADTPRLEPASVDRLRGEDLPEGWSWHVTVACCAIGGACWFAEVSPSGPRRHRGEIPPAVWAAVEARAVRLGLIAGKQEAPAGYTSEVDRDGDVRVETADWLLNHYRARSSACAEVSRAGNADPERWAKHEPARQWVAEVSQRAMLRLQSSGLLP